MWIIFIDKNILNLTYLKIILTPTNYLYKFNSALLNYSKVIPYLEFEDVSKSKDISPDINSFDIS